MTDDLNRLRADEKGQIHVAVCQDHNQRNPARDSPNTHAVVESIVAARTAALLDRAERAETERDDWHESATHRLSEGMRFRGERDALRAAVTNLADEWETEGITCECGHYVGTDHNSLGCYGVVTYTPLVRCSCKLTDNQDADDIAAARLRSLLVAAPTETEGTPDE